MSNFKQEHNTNLAIVLNNIFSFIETGLCPNLSVLISIPETPIKLLSIFQNINFVIKEILRGYLHYNKFFDFSKRKNV